MYVFEGGFNFLKKCFIPAISLPTCLTDVEMVDFLIQNILVTLSKAWEVELLDDVKLLEGFKVSINTGAINPGHFSIKIFLDFSHRNLA